VVAQEYEPKSSAIRLATPPGRAHSLKSQIQHWLKTVATFWKRSGKNAACIIWLAVDIHPAMNGQNTSLPTIQTRPSNWFKRLSLSPAMNSPPLPCVPYSQPWTAQNSSKFLDSACQNGKNPCRKPWQNQLPSQNELIRQLRDIRIRG
jgi:hypothetical protein